MYTYAMYMFQAYTVCVKVYLQLEAVVGWVVGVVTPTKHVTPASSRLALSQLVTPNLTVRHTNYNERHTSNRSGKITSQPTTVRLT